MDSIVSCGIHCNNSLWIFFLNSQCFIVLWIYLCKTQNGGVGCTSLLEIFLKWRSSIQHFKIEMIKDERNACIFASTTYLRCFTEQLPYKKYFCAGFLMSDAQLEKGLSCKSGFLWLGKVPLWHMGTWQDTGWGRTLFLPRMQKPAECYRTVSNKMSFACYFSLKSLPYQVLH